MSDFADISVIVQGIFIIVSVGFIWYQVRENTRLTRTANIQHLVELCSPFYLQMIQDRNQAQLWVQGAKEWDTMDEIDKFRYQTLLTWWLTFHENIYYQWQNKRIDKDIHTSWERDLKQFMIWHNLDPHWQMIEGQFQGPFVRRLHQLIEERKKKEQGRIMTSLSFRCGHPSSLEQNRSR